MSGWQAYSIPTPHPLKCAHPQESKVNSGDVTLFTMKSLLYKCEHVPVRDGVGVPCGWTEQWRGEALKELFIGQGGHCIVCYKTCFFLVNHGHSESLFTFDSVKEMMPCHGTVAVLSGLILRRPLHACLWQLLGNLWGDISLMRSFIMSFVAVVLSTWNQNGPYLLSNACSWSYYARFIGSRYLKENKMLSL